MAIFNKADYLILFDNLLFHHIIDTMEKEFYDDFVNSSFSSHDSRLSAMIKINTLRDLKLKVQSETLDKVENIKKDIA